MELAGDGCGGGPCPPSGPKAHRIVTQTAIAAVRTIILALFAAIRSARARSYSLRGGIVTTLQRQRPTAMQR